ncbi:MAG TPA: hypothetical protein VKU00_15255, partial [Chthonomonadaceae bacterium]|nr:hypothetical protein [Chthonomonadaceae bacterium]
MPLLSPQHSAALTDLKTWTDNPFFDRDARRDNKRRQLTKTLAWVAATIGIFGGLAAWGLAALHQSRFKAYWLVGGDIFTSLSIVICGIHIWFIASVSQKHTAQMMTQEAFRNTLPHLLMLPVSPFRILLQATIYPWWAGMRVALLLLPIYLFFVGIGSMTWVELTMLYLVFAASAYTLPAWRLPALADNLVVTTPTAQRASPVLATTNTLSGQTTTPQPAASSGMNGGMGMLILLPFFMFFTMAFSRRGFGGLYGVLHPYFPDSILSLMPTSMISWPLLLARGIITPFDWYGIALPPLPFLLLFFFVSRYLQLVRTSEYLQVGTYRDLALLPTYYPRRLWEGALRIVQAFVIL